MIWTHKRSLPGEHDIFHPCFPTRRSVSRPVFPSKCPPTSTKSNPPPECRYPPCTPDNPLQSVTSCCCWFAPLFIFLEFYYESIKRESKIRGIKKCRCDERLQTKTKEFTRLPYTGLVLELEHLKIETRLINERFPNGMGECEN